MVATVAELLTPLDGADFLIAKRCSLELVADLTQSGGCAQLLTATVSRDGRPVAAVELSRVDPFLDPDACACDCHGVPVDAFFDVLGSGWFEQITAAGDVLVLNRFAASTQPGAPELVFAATRAVCNHLFGAFGFVLVDLERVADPDGVDGFASRLAVSGLSAGFSEIGFTSLSPRIWAAQGF